VRSSVNLGQGIGAAAQAAAKVGELSAETAQYAKVASAALKASSVAVKQVLDGGKITNWTSVAAAALGGYVLTGQAIAAGADEAYKGAASIGDYDRMIRAEDVYNVATKGSTALTFVSNYVTPWVQVAETYVRHDGKLTPMDWASAAGSTLSQAVANNFGAEGAAVGTPAGMLLNASLRLVYGPSARGALRELQQQAGGQLLTDLPKPTGLTVEQFSINTMEAQLAKGGNIHFDLTHVQDMAGTLQGTGRFASTVTGAELRYLQANWSRFQDNVFFYEKGVRTAAPWAR
jgi:hypothetical protein